MRKRLLDKPMIAMLFVVAAAAVPDAALAVDDEQFTVIKAGRIITVSGEEIINGEIVIVDGEIRLVGRGLEYPGNAKVIDAGDQVVMPGLVHLQSSFGVPDYRRNGVRTHHHVSDDIDLNKIDFDPLLESGYTAVCLVPSGRGLPGMAAVYRTAGPDEVRVLKKNAYLVASMTNPGSDKQVLRGAFRKAREEIAKVEKARQEWEEKQKQAQAGEQKKNDAGEKPENGKGQSQQDEDDKPEEENKGEESKPAEFKPPAIDPGHRRLVELMREEAQFPIVVEISSASDLLHFLDVRKQEPKLPFKLLLSSGFRSDYHYVVDDLSEADLDIATSARVTSLPDTTIRYNLPGELAAAGIDFALMPSGDVLRGVAELVRSGLPRDRALKAAFIAPAQYLGVEAKVGTVEKGKQADLMFLDGDPLDPFTEVRRVMIAGDIVWEKDEQ